jgi:hypothetical protein
MQELTLDPLSVGITGQDRRVDLFQGNSAQISVTVTNADGTAFDLTDAVAQWWVTWSALAQDSETQLRKDTSAGISIADPTTGKLVIDITAHDSSQLIGPYYHEMKVTQGADVVTTMTGLFLVKRNLAMALV